MPLLRRTSAPATETLPGSKAPEAGPGLTLLSWNLHFGIGPAPYGEHRRSAEEVRQVLKRVAERCQALQVDVLLVQELDRESDRSGRLDQLRELRLATGLGHAAWVTTWDRSWVPFPLHVHPSQHYGRVWSGQAVLSRLPIAANRSLPMPQPAANGRVHNYFYRQASVQEVVLDCGRGRKLTLLNAHLEAFDMANRRRQARLLAKRMGELRGPALLAGDLNAIPPESERRHGFVDEPDEDHRGDDSLSVIRATGWSELSDGRLTFPAGAETRRLDHAFASPGLLASGGQVQRPDPPLSDHRALRVEIELEPRPRAVPDQA
ncbi:MAG: endonuclease/exonuclease/phosphatase family protein [Alphaproteobacteria bacterium]|nr:endonuclease/exonuclease/phosphatase family protein [Alphaproteobacteria bacterium]